MAKLFTDIDEFKKFVSVTKATDLESIEPKINHSVKKYIEAWLGKAQLDAIILAHTPGPSTTQQAALIEKTQTSLANFSMFEYVPQAEITISDGGISQMGTENFKPAYSGQIERLRDDLIQTAYDSLEYMLEFLEDNESDYPLWVAGSGYTKNKEFFINSAKEFEEHYPIIRGRQTFKAFRPILDDVECFYIKPSIGPDFYAYLKNKIKLKTAFTTPELEAMRILRKAVAHFTIKNASIQGWVKFTSNGVVYQEHKASETSINERKTANNNQIGIKIQKAEDTGQRYLNKVIDFLDANLDDFPTYRDDIVVNPPEEPCETPKLDQGNTGNGFWM